MNNKPLKQTSDLNLAVIHWLTAGLAMPFVFGILGGILVVLISGSVNENASLTQVVISSISGFVGLVAGAWYSHKYIYKKYLIKTPEKVVNISSSIVAVLLVLGTVSRLLNGEIETKPLEFYSSLIYAAIAILAFYLLSKKLFEKKQDNAVVETQEQAQSKNKQSRIVLWVLIVILLVMAFVWYLYLGQPT